MNFPGASGGRLLPFDAGRLAVRDVLQRALSVPQITAMVDVDMSRTIALRNQTRGQFERQSGAKLGFMPFFLRATAKALRAVPMVNATLVPQGLWLHDRIDLGFSVDTPRGAHVPVIREADRKTVAQLAVEIHEKSQRARMGALRLEELMGGTFGVSNPGTKGIVRDVPLVIPPHVGALTCGVIEERPVAVQGRVEVRPMTTLSLALDHRALDGEQASNFFRVIKGCLEQAKFG